MKLFIKTNLPCLFRCFRDMNLLKQAYFSKYGRIPGAINYQLSVLLQWREIAARRRTADALSLPASLTDTLATLNREGFCKLRLTDVTSDAQATELIDALRAAAVAFGTPSHADMIEKLNVSPTKSYFYDIAKTNVAVRAQLEAFAKGSRMLGLAAKYLGQMPLIESVSFIYSPPTNSSRLIAAQGWHLDREQKSKLKIFLSPFEVTTDSGPTTLLPLRHSVGKKYPNFPAYFSDTEALAAGIRVDQKVELTTKVPDFHMADTSRLFHYGARDQKQPRFLVIISYCPLESRLSGPLRKQVKDNAVTYLWSHADRAGA